MPKVEGIGGMPALQRLNLEDDDMETVPRYLRDVSPSDLVLDCSFSLLTCIAAGKSSPEWHKFRNIQQVKAYADDDKGSPSEEVVCALHKGSFPLGDKYQPICYYPR
jgi:hypothetical protein